MKPTQITDLLSNVRATFVSFFSILMFVALGVGVFVGIYWEAPAMQRSAEEVFDEGNLHHVQVIYPYGMTQDDLDQIAALDEVDQVEAARQALVRYRTSGGTCTFKLQTVGRSIDALTVEEGSLPVRADQIALKATSARALGLGVGDVVTFVHDDEADPDGMAQLTADAYTVTALVESGEYICPSSATYGLSGSGSVDALAWVAPAAFDGEAYYGGYTLANIRVAGLVGESTFTDAYKETSASVERAVAELGAERAPQRYASLRDQAQTAIADGEEQLGLAREVLEGADLVVGLAQSFADALPFEGLQRIAAKLAELAGRVHDFADDGQAQLDSAKATLASMKEYAWNVAGRSFNGGAMQVETFSSITSRLALSMAGLFVIVGLLVTYSAISRIVHEQITQIGTKKALGLRGSEITASFLAYSALAVIAGAIIGAAVGVIVVEGILSHALGSRFIMGSFPPYVDVPVALGITAVELVLVCGVTWLACRRILREHAVELLKGERPPEARTRFYERWALWERLPLLTQTIVNNCVNDKRRVFSTIVGVAGCTALIVTAITLNDDVLASYDRQYADVYGYDAVASVGASSTPSAQAALADAGAEATALVRRQNFLLSLPDGSRSAIKVVVPLDADAFGQVYHIVSVEGGEASADSRGAWVSRAYADHNDAAVGDDLVLDAGDGVAVHVPIAGFYEYYLLSYEAVLSPEVYEEAFGTAAQANTLLIDTGASTAAEIAARAEGTQGLGTLTDDKTSQRRNFDEFSRVSGIVVLVYLAMATLMAVVVLLNLNTMFIEEKRRELIVLMINGFSTRDAKRYIYNDAIVLTVLGIVAGLVLGAIMGSVTVGAIEVASAHFVKGIAWRAIAVGTLGSAVLATGMCAIALRRIPRFDLTDINRF